MTGTSDTLFLSQRKYVADLLNKVELESCRGVDRPFSTTEKLSKEKGTKFIDPTFYRSAIGSLQYALFTRPE